MTSQIFDYYMTALTTPYCSIQPVQSFVIAGTLIVVFIPLLIWMNKK